MYIEILSFPLVPCPFAMKEQSVSPAVGLKVD